MTTGASRPWNLSTVPTRIPVALSRSEEGEASEITYHYLTPGCTITSSFFPAWKNSNDGQPPNDSFPMSTEEQLPPNYGKLDLALRSIGYSFEVAVADVVDNSIDASAKTVAVRLLIQSDGHLDLAIWDNGSGMSSQTLKEAMRFGSDVSQEIERLGKFGLGLKLASLSQAKEVTVVSAKGGRFAGRAWLEHGISKGFTSTVFGPQEAEAIALQLFADRKIKSSGTIVWWSRLYRIGQSHGTSEQHAQKLMQRLENYLSLAFHRFLAGRARKVNIIADIVEAHSGDKGIPMTLDPLDPFGYSAPGAPGFPKDLAVDSTHAKALKIKAHIWPPNSNAPGYKLPGGANSRQGFYFYRNNRLIQGGGWNGIREAEPHSSLARVEIDMVPDFDIAVSLDVKKVEIQLPPDVVASIQRARSDDGMDFKKYMSVADKAYRTRAVIESELPLIPSDGLPADLVAFLRSELRHTSTAKRRDLQIMWKALDKASFFDIDPDAGRLYLNSAYRKRVLHGLSASSADAPVVKCLLFLVLEEALSSERMGSRISKRIEQINRILVRAVKHERVGG